MEESILFEILKEMQKKYTFIVEIERITREMGDALSRNDRESVQLLLGMRQDEMNKADVCTRNVDCLVSALSPEDGSQVREWLNCDGGRNPDSPIAGMLVEKRKSIQLALKRTIEADRYISMRLSGKDSFYQ
ncbi:hypothetical protein SAMN05443270_2267 [Lacrimispora sphenoides]|jgi:hypothetical protein|uniref:hypothetical protein n=1 Tax=Lacrimispora sphenoides TaxID=29370 RepID=UPI0008C42EE2|nr:hypothetical protein [Lacrimispora sphenoides]SET95744.1 hypothetical protein SAMN05443270_2267 [Lacrimispora sphenoides]